MCVLTCSYYRSVSIPFICKLLYDFLVLCLAGFSLIWYALNNISSCICTLMADTGGMAAVWHCGFILCRCHFTQVPLWPFFGAATSAQLWEPLLRQHKSSQTVGGKKTKLKRLVVSLGLCRCCFCFYYHGIHDGLKNRGPVSDRLQCPRCTAW